MESSGTVHQPATICHICQRQYVLSPELAASLFVVSPLHRFLVVCRFSFAKVFLMYGVDVNSAISGNRDDDMVLASE